MLANGIRILLSILRLPLKASAATQLRRKWKSVFTRSSIDIIINIDIHYVLHFYYLLHIKMHEEENRKENNGDIKPPYFMLYEKGI